MDWSHPFQPKDPKVVGSRENADGTVTEGPVCAVCGCLQDDPQHQ